MTNNIWYRSHRENQTQINIQEDWLIDCCLISSEQYFNYCQEENMNAKLVGKQMALTWPYSRKLWLLQENKIYIEQWSWLENKITEITEK
jgi:hypothetical protein